MSEEATLDKFVPEADSAEDDNPETFEDWCEVKLIDLCEMGGGSTPKKSNLEYWNGGDILWTTPKDFDGPRLKETEDKITKKGASESTSKIYPEGTTLLVVRSGILKHTLPVSIVEEPTTINQDLKALVPDRGKVNPEYFFQALSGLSEDIRGSCKKTGTTVESIQTNVLKQYPVPVPPLSEQRKIATVLYTVDRAIEKANQIIDQICRVKKGTVRDFLSGDNSDRQKIERWVGPKKVTIPQGWSVQKIGEISDIKNGNRIVKGHDYSDSVTEYPFIRIVDMKDGTVSTKNLKYLKKETAEKMRRGIIYSDEVYITVTGRVGDAGTIPDELDGARFTDNAAKLYNLEGTIPEYLSLYLRSKYGLDEVHRFTVGSTQPKLSMYRVEKMEVVVPPVEEQKKIVKRVNDIEEGKKKNEKIIENLISFKRGLLQDLLSGTIRTTDTNIEVPEEIAQYA